MASPPGVIENSTKAGRSRVSISQSPARERSYCGGPAGRAKLEHERGDRRAFDHPACGRSNSRKIGMFRFFAALIGALALAAPAYAITPFPDGFRGEEIATNGTTLHVRVGGHGPAVVMLHGFGDTGDMWAPVAAALAADNTVVVPDLRGMGFSAHPDDGYTKKNEAADIAGLMDALNIQERRPRHPR